MLCIGLMVAHALPILAQDDIPTTYGTMRANEGHRSINGTSALAKMLEWEFYTTTRSARRLSPRIEQVDTMFWFPDTDTTMTTEVQERFETWLKDGYGRTLVVVGRDYDALSDYLETAGASQTGEESAKYRRRLTRAKVDRLLRDAQWDEPIADAWVQWQPAPTVRATSVDSPVPDGIVDQRIDGVNVTVGLYPEAPSNPAPGRNYRTTLVAEERPFVVEITDSSWDEGRILVVANGSFLLNYGLTNSQNREVAMDLLNDISPGSVLFLESDEMGLPVQSYESPSQPTMWDWMKVWPFSFIIPHLIVIGVLAYFVYFPIFGRPRVTEIKSPTDFGQHVEALGELMEKTHDKDYAVRQLKNYHEHVRRDSTGLGMKSKS